MATWGFPVNRMFSCARPCEIKNACMKHSCARRGTVRGGTDQQVWTLCNRVESKWFEQWSTLILYLDPRRPGWLATGENSIARSFINCTVHQIFFGLSNEVEWDGLSMWNVWETEEVHTGFWWWNINEGVYLENLGLDGRIILKWVCNK